MFSYERMTLGDTVRAGFFLNIIGIVLIVAVFLAFGLLALGCRSRAGRQALALGWAAL